MACHLCETRRPRRQCPGVHGDICAPCCGSEREITITCPFDCQYLQEARNHERPPELDPEKIPHRDIQVSEKFLEEQSPLIEQLASGIVSAAVGSPGTIDSDVREALDALVRTYRTLVSGLYYETLPNNPLAAAICRAVQHTVDEIRKHEAQRTGVRTITDKDVLGVLVFLSRLEQQAANGRQRGRAFLHFMYSHFARELAMAEARQAASPLLITP